MEGPKAPKDPVEKGSSFYICRGKDIAGGEQPDGRGTQYIYLNDVRLVTFANMVGNITDEKMLAKLESAEGFLSMVAGIGVTVEMEEPSTAIDFVFQMYGKTDPNHSGTTLRLSCRADGMENILWLDTCEWSGDDDIPGQMRFEFPRAGLLARVDVKLYLRKGFTAPAQEEPYEVEPASAAYGEMVARSLMQLGNPNRLKQVIARARAGEQVTLAFIGGSITQGAGAVPINTQCYAYQTLLRFREAFGGGANLRFVKAGAGGTSSELGMIRFERDVMKEQGIIPDLVVVEFAVNDEGDETKGLCYECLVRKILALSEKTAVVLLFAVFANDWNLQERLMSVGERYELPMVSIKNAVAGWKVLSKSRFFYDSYHPANVGHSIMADCLMHLFRQADLAPYGTEYFWQEKSPVFGTDFTEVKLLDKKNAMQRAIFVKTGSFCHTDEALQAVEMDEDFGTTKLFPFNWQHRQGEEPFRMCIHCKSLLLVSKDSGEITAGKADVLVDGRRVLTADPREIGWIHCNAQILFSESESREHLVEIRMAQGEERKEFTILGFGYTDG